MKRILVITLIFLLLPLQALAASIVSDSGVISSFDPESDNSGYMALFNTGSAVQFMTVQEMDSSFSSVIDTFEHDAAADGYTHFAGVKLACNKYWKVTLKDGSKNVIGTFTADVTGGVCSPPPDSGGSLCPECSRLDAIKSVNDQILNAINSNGSTLGSILGELRSDVFVSTGSVPSVVAPSSSGRIEGNKPSEKPVFTDDRTYFSDGGDAAESPGAMPAVPDVEDWEGVLKEPDGAPEGELVKDPEKQKDVEGQKDPEGVKDLEKSKDPELVKDNMSQEPEMVKDNMTQDPILSQDLISQDPELNKDTMIQDPIMSSDNFSQTEIYDFTNGGMNQTHIYSQTEFYDVSH